MSSNNDRRSEFASPPCFMHELDPAYMTVPAGDAQTNSDVARWRKAERSRLIAERMIASADARSRASMRISERLEQEVFGPNGSIIGIYWPFRGEPDLRGWGQIAVSRGARLALPVVVSKGQPLAYRTWSPGEKLEKGVWNIPIPSGGTEVYPENRGRAAGGLRRLQLSLGLWWRFL